MKKAALSLEFIFLIFLGTIAVMVVIGMITNWSFSINKGIKKLSEEDKDVKDDLSELNVSMYPCDRQASEIAKNIKLCMEKGQKGNLPMSGSCYVVEVYRLCNLNTLNFDL